MRIKTRLVLAAIAVLIAAIAGLRIASSVKKTAKVIPREQVLVVRAHTITRGQLVDEIKVSGTIKPVNEVEIFPKLAGRMISLRFDLGDVVKVGDILGVIEHKEISLQEKSAQASLVIAQTNEQLALNDLERSKKLFSEGALAQAQLEALELKFAINHAQAQAARAQAELSSQQVANANISSLVSGVIVKRAVSLGANVSPSMAVFSVHDISTLKLVTSVDRHTLMRLKKGSKARLRIEHGSGKTFTGTVARLSPSLDARSRRATVEIEIDDPDKSLVPNMFVEGSLVFDTQNHVLTIPNQAISAKDNQPRVFRIVQGKIQVITPELGQHDQHNTLLLAGLNEGDIVATSGLDHLREGISVTIEKTARE